MTFPTIPIVADGHIVGLNQLDTVATLTGPNLNTLTKAAGDLLVAIAGEYQSNAGTDAAYTGWAGGGLTWTEIRDSTGTAVNRLGVAIARVVTGSETGTVTVTRSGTLVGDASIIVLVVPGAHATTDPEATVMATAANATPGAAPATLTPSWGAEDTLWVGVNGSGMTSATSTWLGTTGAPTNYTGFFDTAAADTSTIGDFDMAVAFRQLNAASETMAGFAVDATLNRTSALLIAVRPAPAQPASGADPVALTGTLTTTGVVGTATDAAVALTATLTAAGSVAAGGGITIRQQIDNGSNGAAMSLTLTSAQVGDTVVLLHADDWYTASGLLTPGGTAVSSWGTVKHTLDGGADDHHCKVWVGTVTTAGGTVTENSTNVDQERYFGAWVLAGAVNYGTAASTDSDTTSTSHVAPSVTPTTGKTDDLLICLFGTAASGGTINYTMPGGMTARTEYDISPWNTYRAADQALTSDAATGTRTATSSGNVEWFAVSVLMETAAGGGAFSGTATRALTATLAAAAILGTTTGATIPLTATITAAGVVGASSGASLSLTDTLTSAGSVTSGLSGSATVPLTDTITTAGVVGTATDASVPLTGTVTAAGTVGASTGAAAALTDTITSAGTVGKSSSATTPLTVTITAAGSVGAAGASGATVPLTDSITTVGVVGASTGATLAATDTLTAAGSVGKTTGTAAPLTVTITAAGTVVAGGSAGAIIPITVTLVSAGTVARSSPAALPLLATVTATGTVARASGATLPLTATITATGAVVGANDGVPVRNPGTVLTMPPSGTTLTMPNSGTTLTMPATRTELT